MANSNNKSVDIKICHVNCQSLYGHWEEFKLFFENSDYRVICISESWLKGKIITDDMIKLNNYKVFRNDRERCGAGGVAIYVHNSLSGTELAKSIEGKKTKPEWLILEVSNTESKILVATIYRPPKIGRMADFENTFTELSVHYQDLVIMGDLNTNTLADKRYDTKNLNEFVHTTNMCIVPFSPTNHTSSAETHIDHAIVDDIEKINDFGQFPVAFLSSHDLIWIDITLTGEFF